MDNNNNAVMQLSIYNATKHFTYIRIYIFPNDCATIVGLGLSATSAYVPSAYVHM